MLVWVVIGIVAVVFLVLVLPRPTKENRPKPVAAAPETPLERWLRPLRGYDPAAARQAAEQLGQLRDPAAVGPLLTAIKFGEPALRLVAARALEQIGKPGVEQLRKALADSDPFVRREVERILGKLDESAEENKPPASVANAAAPEPPR